jgi:hypothetical protein
MKTILWIDAGAQSICIEDVTVALNIGDAVSFRPSLSESVSGIVQGRSFTFDLDGNVTITVYVNNPVVDRLLQRGAK